jgi:hypothetical protein
MTFASDPAIAASSWYLKNAFFSFNISVGTNAQNSINESLMPNQSQVINSVRAIILIENDLNLATCVHRVDK